MIDISFKYLDHIAMHQFPFKPEPFITTLARLLAGQGATREVAILANAQPIIECIDTDSWNGTIYYYMLNLCVPVWFYRNLSEQELEDCSQAISDICSGVLAAHPNDKIMQVTITPKVERDPNWRDKAQAWLAGVGVTNQGRVRSENVASRSMDGLLFRSQAEINLYLALKRLGVSFAPLPVFIRGGKSYARIEPDFIVIKDGIVLCIEVDGDTIHHETPVEAHNRTTMLVHEGAHLERVKASECATPELANQCAEKMLRVIDKIKNSR